MTRTNWNGHTRPDGYYRFVTHRFADAFGVGYATITRDFVPFSAIVWC